MRMSMRFVVGRARVRVLVAAAVGSLLLASHAQAQAYFGAARRGLAGGPCASGGRSLAFHEGELERLRGGLGLFRTLYRRSVERSARAAARRLADRCVRLNQVQVIGTHNSYHRQPAPDAFEALLRVSAEFLAWEYTHLPLDEQFATQGIRQIELDVFADPEGGLYERRGGLIVIGQDPHSGIPELLQPGMKVLHVQDLDFRTTCLTFVACLETVKRWSDENPSHLPIMVLVEAKDDVLPDVGLGFAVPVPFGPDEFDDLDAEIRSVIPARQLLTPDDVRRGAATLREVVVGAGWPTLGEVRGKILFGLDNGGQKRLDYLEGHPSLEDRVLFTNAPPEGDDAAFVKRNDPGGDPAEIPGLVRRGFIVRTRADADVVQGRDGNTTRRDDALASGAQFVSTDFPVENPDFGTGYRVRLPGDAVARCNPINAPTWCRDDALE